MKTSTILIVAGMALILLFNLSKNPNKPGASAESQTDASPSHSASPSVLRIVRVAETEEKALGFTATVSCLKVEIENTGSEPVLITSRVNATMDLHPSVIERRRRDKVTGLYLLDMEQWVDCVWSTRTWGHGIFTPDQQPGDKRGLREVWSIQPGARRTFGLMEAPPTWRVFILDPAGGRVQQKAGGDLTKVSNRRPWSQNRSSSALALRIKEVAFNSQLEKDSDGVECARLVAQIKNTGSRSLRLSLYDRGPVRVSSLTREKWEQELFEAKRDLRVMQRLTKREVPSIETERITVADKIKALENLPFSLGIEGLSEDQLDWSRIDYDPVWIPSERQKGETSKDNQIQIQPGQSRSVTLQVPTTYIPHNSTIRVYLINSELMRSDENIVRLKR